MIVKNWSKKSTINVSGNTSETEKLSTISCFNTTVGKGRSGKSRAKKTNMKPSGIMSDKEALCATSTVNPASCVRIDRSIKRQSNQTFQICSC